MHFKGTTSLLIIFGFLATPLFTQKNIKYQPWDWVTYQYSGYVNSIADGSQFIYFATNGGILRYQIFGKYWDYPVTQSQGLPENKVLAIYYDFQTHFLWASTESGVHYSTDRGGNWQSISRSYLGLQPNEKIEQIGSTQDFLWFKTNYQLMKLNNFSGFLMLPYASLPEDTITWGSAHRKRFDDNSEMLDGFGVTGVWMNQGVQFYGPELEVVTATTIHQDRFGDIWVGTSGGPLFYGDRQMQTLEPLKPGPAQTDLEILLDDTDVLWMGGYSRGSQHSGITFFNIERDYWNQYRGKYEIHFGIDQITCGVKVKNEWWFGTPQGIQVFDTKDDSWFFISEVRGLADSFISSLVYNEETVFAGTQRGLTELSPPQYRSITQEYFNLFRGIRIYDLYWDNYNLWIAAEIGLFRWQSESLFYFNGTNFVNVPKNYKIEISELGIILRVQQITGSGNNVYFAHDYGIFIFDKKTTTWSESEKGHHILNSKINDLEVISFEGEDEYLWVAANNGAILIDLKEDFIQRFNKNDGLPSNDIHSISVMDDVIWFGTPNGLCRFNWQ